jgi:ribosomal protein S27AE
MSSNITIERDNPANPGAPDEDSGIVHEHDHTPSARSCPMCGSSATYQTPDGRWGCTQCGSTWA